MDEKQASTTTYERPGVASSYADVWAAIQANLPQLIGVLMVSVIWGITGNIWELAGMPSPLTDFGIAGILYVLVSVILVSFPLGYGVNYVCLRAVRKEKLQIRDVLAGFRRYFDGIVTCLLSDFLILVGLVCLIVPGIWVACRLSLSPFFVVDRKMHPVEAMKESWRLTKGYAWKIFLIGLAAFITTGIVSLLLLFISGGGWDTLAGVVIQTVGSNANNMAIWFALASLYNRLQSR